MLETGNYALLKSSAFTSRSRRTELRREAPLSSRVSRENLLQTESKCQLPRAADQFSLNPVATYNCRGKTLTADVHTDHF